MYRMYKIFGQKSGLTQHLLIHTEVKNYQSTKCSKLFRHIPAVTRHMVIRTEAMSDQYTENNRSSKDLPVGGGLLQIVVNSSVS